MSSTPIKSCKKYVLSYKDSSKSTHQLGLFDCSEEFLQSGQNKVAKAVQSYNEFFAGDGMDLSQYYINKTL